MASLCRRFALVAPNLSRSLFKTVTTGPQNVTVSKVHNRQFGEIHRRFCSAKPLPQKEKVTIHFMTGDGDRQSVQAKVGENLLDVIIENDVDIDGFGSSEDTNGHFVRPIMLGACEGTLACSTCHLIFKPADFDKLPEKPSDEELDMLDLAYGLTDTSRLGCQVIVSKDMEGWEVRVPEGVADAREP